MKKTGFFLLLAISTSVLAAPDIEVGFSSGKADHSCEALVLRLIDGAQKSIKMMAYEFKAPDVIAALNRAADRGVKVEVVVDYRGNRGSKPAIAGIPAALRHGVQIRVDSHYHIQHDKVMIIDDNTLETGSFNYTVTAEKANSENLLVLRNVPRIVRQYEQHFASRWAYGVPYTPGRLAVKGTDPVRQGRG